MVAIDENRHGPPGNEPFIQNASFEYEPFMQSNFVLACHVSSMSIIIEILKNTHRISWNISTDKINKRDHTRFLHKTSIFCVHIFHEFEIKETLQANLGNQL